jgi:transcriptional regulator with XRE-family HTH domain
MKSNSVTEDYKLLLKRIGENLSKARIEKGLSQRELGRVAEKNHTVIAKVEKYPPLDLTLRSIYEVARHIPISLTEIFSKSEDDLELQHIRNEPKKIDERMKFIMNKLSDLTREEQVWMADMIEGLLARTSSPSKLTDKTDKTPLHV